MFDYKKIVYAINPNDSVLEYLKEVAGYAHRKSAELHVVTVHKTTFDYGYGAGVTQETPNQIVKNSLQEKFSSLTHAFNGKNNVICKLLESDSIADGIIDYVSKLGVDLLILNARDHGALGRMGSAASKISNHAPCDVVLLKNVQKSI